MVMYGLHSFIFVFKKKKKKRSAAVTEHHAAASHWTGVLPWYYATGPVRTQCELIRLPHGSVAVCDSQKVYSCLSNATSFLLSLTVQCMLGEVVVNESLLCRDAFLLNMSTKLQMLWLTELL